MIAWLRGELLQKDLEKLVLNVQGVGYQVFVPLNTFHELPELGQQVTLRVQTVVREDAIDLFGFLTDAEREAFVALIGIAGIGPRLARNILSGIRPHELAEAVFLNDGERLRSIPGVGKRMAERILVELQGNVLRFASEKHVRGLDAPEQRDQDAMKADVMSALLNLGYKKSEVAKIVRTARAAIQGPVTLESWVRDALRLLSK